MERTIQVPLDRNSYWQEEHGELPNVCGASIYLSHNGYILADGTGQDWVFKLRKSRVPTHLTAKSSFVDLCILLIWLYLSVVASTTPNLLLFNLFYMQLYWRYTYQIRKLTLIFVEGITPSYYNSKSNWMPSPLKDDFSDSFKGASVSRIREGRLDKPELLFPPVMAELQLEREDDEWEFIDDDVEGSCDAQAPSLSSGLQLKTPHSSFCLFEVFIVTGLAWVCIRFSSDRMIMGSWPRPFSWLRRIIPVSNRWYIRFSRHSANSLASARATSERVLWRCVRGKGIGAESVELVGLGLLSRLILLERECEFIIVDWFIRKVGWGESVVLIINCECAVAACVCIIIRQVPLCNSQFVWRLCSLAVVVSCESASRSSRHYLNMRGVTSVPCGGRGSGVNQANFNLQFEGESCIHTLKLDNSITGLICYKGVFKFW